MIMITNMNMVSYLRDKSYGIRPFSVCWLSSLQDLSRPRNIFLICLSFDKYRETETLLSLYMLSSLLHAPTLSFYLSLILYVTLYT